MHLFISHHCFLCRFVEPIVRGVARFFGHELRVFKVYPDGMARQVNGDWALDVRKLPGVPALVVGRRIFVGVPQWMAFAAALAASEEGR